jgi:protein-disulfide isomerase
MRALVLLISLTLALAACKGAETPAPEGQATPEGNKPPAEGTAPAVAAPAATASAAVAPKPAAVTKPAPLTLTPPPGAKSVSPNKERATAATMKDLEKQPGVTAALKTSTAKAGKRHPDLKGKPGPSPASGSDQAPVKVYVFSDFQCPVCKRVVEPMKALARELGDQVQVVFKQNALEMHPNAFVSAAASMAAYKQGKFWEYHDRLFQNQRNLAEPDLLVYAEELGLDMARFKKDMNSTAIKDQIEYERNLAGALGMRGTPGFFINGHKMVGWGSYGGFRGVVNRALKSAQGVNITTRTKAVNVARVATEKFSGPDGVKFAELVWGK